MPKPLSATTNSGRGCSRKAGASKLVTSEENVARLLQSVIVGEIDIVKISGNRCTLSVEFEVGRLYGGCVSRKLLVVAGGATILAMCVSPLAQISPEIG